MDDPLYFLKMQLSFIHVKALSRGFSMVSIQKPTTKADRRGAAGRCSTAVRGVPGSNPGSGMDVVFVRCWFSLSSLFLVTAVWNRHGLWKSLYYPMSSRAESFVLNWLTVTITKSNKKFQLPFVINTNF